MDNESSTPPTPLPEPPYSRRKDPYAEPPIKDFSHLLTKKPTGKSNWRSKRALLLFIVVVIVVAGGVYWQFFRTQPVAKSETTKTPIATQQPLTTQTTSYTATGFGMTLDYPSTWTVAGDGTTSLTITSPVMQLTSASGQSVKGKVIFSVAPQGKIPSEFGSTPAEAVLPSQLLKYAKPGTTQAAQTYVSFVQYSSATIVGTLNALYVTGNYGYQKAQLIQSSDLSNLNPLITITFGQCTGGSACSGLQDLSVSSAIWNNSTFSNLILTMLQSITFT